MKQMPSINSSIFVIILLSFFCASCEHNKNSKSFGELDILKDASKPVIFDDMSDFKSYFRKHGFRKVSYNEFNENAVFIISDTMQYMDQKEHVDSININTKASPILMKLSFINSLNLSLSLLPKHPPLKEKYLEKFPFKNLNFENLDVKLYYSVNENKLIYSTTFMSKEKKPVPFSSEYLPSSHGYSKSIVIKYTVDGVENIMIGGYTFSPFKHRDGKYLSLKPELIKNQTEILKILSNGPEKINLLE